jgi:hypothetical protein
MADQTPAIAQVDGPPPDLSPAIKPPPVTIPHPDAMFDAIKETRPNSGLRLWRS